MIPTMCRCCLRAATSCSVAAGSGTLEISAGGDIRLDDQNYGLYAAAPGL